MRSFTYCLVPSAALIVAAIGGAAPATQSAETSAASAFQQAKADGVDLGGIVETLRHRVERRGGRLVAEDPRYRLELSSAGFVLRLRDTSKAPRQRRGRSELSTRLNSRPIKRHPRGSVVLFDQSAPLGITLSRIRASTGDLELQQIGWKRDQNHAERTLAPGLRERLTAKEGRLNWELRLDRPPNGKTRLSVEAHVRAAGHPRRIGNSWQWPLAGRRALRVGELKVSDTNGRRVPGGSLRARGDQLVIDVPSPRSTTHYPLKVDLVVSPEYPASEAVYLRAAGSDQEAPSAAWSGDQYLVVWHTYGVDSLIDVYGARVTADGEVLDPAGIPIGTRSSYQQNPAVASDGEDFLVVWEDYYQPFRVVVSGARVDHEGTVLDSLPIDVSPPESEALAPSLAWDGTNYFVAWFDFRNETDDLYGARVSSDGTVLDETHRRFLGTRRPVGTGRRLERDRVPSGLGGHSRCRHRRLRIARNRGGRGSRSLWDPRLDSAAGSGLHHRRLERRDLPRRLGRRAQHD